MTVLLDRPPANAFDLALYEELDGVLDRLAARRPPPPCLLLGSAVPRFFSGGRDIHEPGPADADAVTVRRRVVTGLYRRLYEFPTPVLAVVEGYALGTGCVIASLCDARLATPDARFGLPEVKAGSVGGARHLMRVLPRGTVRWMALTGETLDAPRALALGLVEAVHPSEEVWEVARRQAGSIAALDPDVVGRTKQAMNAAEDLPLWEGFAAEQEVGGSHVGARRAR